MTYVRNEMKTTLSSSSHSIPLMPSFHMQTVVSSRKPGLTLHDVPFVAKYNTTAAYRSRRILPLSASVADKSSFRRESEYIIHWRAGTAAESSGSEEMVMFNLSAKIPNQFSVSVGTADGFRVGDGVNVGVDVGVDVGAEDGLSVGDGVDVVDVGMDVGVNDSVNVGADDDVGVGVEISVGIGVAGGVDNGSPNNF